MEPIVFKMSYDVCNPLGRWSACYTMFKKSFPSFVQIHKLNTALSSEQSIAGLHLGIQLFEKKLSKSKPKVKELLVVINRKKTYTRIRVFALENFSEGR